MASSGQPPANITNIIEGSTKLDISPLSGGDNWKTWKVRVTDWLEEKEMGDIITTQQPVVDPSATPAVTQEMVDKWNKQDRKAIAIIRRYVTDKVLTNIIAVLHARDAWD